MLPVCCELGFENGGYWREEKVERNGYWLYPEYAAVHPIWNSNVGILMCANYLIKIFDWIGAHGCVN